MSGGFPVPDPSLVPHPKPEVAESPRVAVGAAAPRAQAQPPASSKFSLRMPGPAKPSEEQRAQLEWEMGMGGPCIPALPGS